MSTDDVLASLPSLPRSDLERVRAAASYLLGRHESDSGDSPTSEAQAVFDALALRLGSTRRTYVGLVKCRSTFEADCRGVVAWVRDHLERRERGAVPAALGALAHLLVEDLQRRGIPATIGVALNQAKRMPEVFCASFPGYALSGKIGLVLDAYRDRVGGR